MIFTRAMLVCSKDFKSFLSRFWSWILINLWYDLKASTLVRAPNPWARCVVGLFFGIFRHTWNWHCPLDCWKPLFINELYFQSSKYNKDTLQMSLPEKRTVWSWVSGKKSEGRSPLEETNMKCKTRRVQNNSAASRICQVERIYWEQGGSCALEKGLSESIWAVRPRRHVD